MRIIGILRCPAQRSRAKFRITGPQRAVSYGRPHTVEPPPHEPWDGITTRQRLSPPPPSARPAHSPYPRQSYDPSKEPILTSAKGIPFLRISTLRHERCLREDFMDLSGKPTEASVVPATYIWKSCARPKLQDSPPRPFQIFYYDNDRRRPFPPNTSGYLYFNSPTGVPNYAGEMRFRLASPDPSSMRYSRDLMTPDGMPWRIPFLYMCMEYKAYASALATLFHNYNWAGFPTVMSTKSSYSAALGSMTPATHVLHRTRQAVPVDFSKGGLHLWLIHKLPCQRADINSRLGADPRGGKHLRQPYKCKAICRFEVSRLPEHAGTRTLVLRIIKIVEEPVAILDNYDGFVPVPTLGELVYEGDKPWFCDVDQTHLGDSYGSLGILEALLNGELPP